MGRAGEVERGEIVRSVSDTLIASRPRYVRTQRLAVPGDACDVQARSGQLPGVRGQWVLFPKGVVEVIEGLDRLVPFFRKPKTDDRNDLGCAFPC